MKYMIILAAALVAMACGPQIHVYSHHDPDYPVRNFSTFDRNQKSNIEENKNPLYYNELNDKRSEVLAA